MSSSTTGGSKVSTAPGAAGDSEAIAHLEALARHDPGGRGLSSTAPDGLLEPAAQALLGARRVMIVTGFCVRAAMIGETDGPPGATALASTLTSLGATVMILTDRYSAGLVEAACRTRRPRLPDKTACLAVPVASLPDDEGRAAQACLDLAAEFAPDLVLAVERPGGATDGHRYSMRGTILDDIAPSADVLFQGHEGRNWKTAAIGDGGNELGMGSLRASCASAVAMGEQIFCTASSDFPVAAGISNWGAYALAGAISVLAGKVVLPDPAEESSVLHAVYEAGGVDGCTREHSCSVDGLPADEYLRIIRQMHNLVLESI